MGGFNTLDLPDCWLKSESESLQLCPTLCDPWTVALQAPLSMEYSRQEYWRGRSFPSPGDLQDAGITPRSPALQAVSLPSEPQGSWLLVGPSKLWFILRVLSMSLLKNSNIKGIQEKEGCTFLNLSVYLALTIMAMCSWPHRIRTGFFIPEGTSWQKKSKSSSDHSFPCRQGHLLIIHMGHKYFKFGKHVHIFPSNLVINLPNISFQVPDPLAKKPATEDRFKTVDWKD